MQILFLSALASEESTGEILEKLYRDKTKEEDLTRVLAVIDHIAQNGGTPNPPLAQPLRDIGDEELCEIRTNYDKKILLRIYYFVHKESRSLILLNAITKPDGRKSPSQYQGGAGKRLQRKIDSSIQLALELKKLYPTTKNNYEPINELGNL